MARKTKDTRPTEHALEDREIVDQSGELVGFSAGVDEAQTETEQAAETPEAPAPRSVVQTRFKRAYQDRAIAAGHKDKVSKRGNGDWLQRELQAETTDKKGRFNLERFVEILDANGVGADTYGRWKREKPSDIGRFRMSGSIVLRGIVGKTGILRTPDGETNVTELAEQGDEAAAAFLERWAN